MNARQIGGRAWRMVVGALVLLGVGLIGGCGASRHPAVGVPGDFALGVTVLGSSAWSEAPRAYRPAQYLVEGDGSLRVSVGAGVTPMTYPPRLRRLTPGQMERLWMLAESGGFATFPHPGRLDDVRGFRPAPRDGWAVIDIAARGQRQAMAVRLEEDAGAVRLADELAGLSWIRP